MILTAFHQENDSQTTPGQALLLQQRLTEVNHPDHMMINPIMQLS